VKNSFQTERKREKQKELIDINFLFLYVFSPIYTAVFFISLFFLFASIHLLIWSLTLDFCGKHISYIQQNSTREMIQRNWLPDNSSLPLGLYQFLTEKVLANITLILYCSPNQTIFDVYGTTLNETFHIYRMFHSFLPLFNCMRFIKKKRFFV
jgi:hypothetical protein